MCGIFAYIGKRDDSGKIILNGLRALEYRGYDSWGIALKQKNNTLYLERHTGKISNNKIPQYNSFLGIGHTRWATHGGVAVKNAHPHVSKDQKIAIVHNGIIENFQDLKNNLHKKGYKFKTETDTEVLIHLLQNILTSEKNKIIAVRKMFKAISGLNAVIVMFKETEEFIAIKNGSPIAFGKNKDGFFLASDAAALAPHTKKIHFLEDNSLLYFNKKEFSINHKTKSTEAKFITLPYSLKNTKKGKYPHYMAKEINEQPKLLREITKTQQNNIKKASKLVKESYGTYLLGCGTAYYAALAATYLFSKIAKRHVNAQIGSEFTYVEGFIKKTSLVIPLSQSGETIDIVASTQKAKDRGAKILAITNILGSTLYRKADYKLLLNAGPEKCVLATKSFTSKIALVTLMAHTLAGSYKKGEKDTIKAALQTEKLIKDKNIKNLAKKISTKKNIFILGRGLSYPTALESALKIKEVSYIHAEGFAGGELKHGVIALIEKGTPVIVYNPEDETYHDTLSSAHEVKARGAYVIGVSSKKNDVYDEFIKVENCNEATIIPNVVTAQLLAYYLALEKGTDPDKPRNLAKSVTVK